jgi:hypothetical protein
MEFFGPVSFAGDPVFLMSPINHLHFDSGLAAVIHARTGGTLAPFPDGARRLAQNDQIDAGRALLAETPIVAVWIAFPQTSA